jgi:hypothetical protein
MMSERLENGMILVVLSPREAVMVRDSVLDPGDFPWMFTEQQHTAMRFKDSLMAQILPGTGELLAGIAGLPEAEERDPDNF